MTANCSPLLRYDNFCKTEKLKGDKVKYTENKQTQTQQENTKENTKDK